MPASVLVAAVARPLSDVDVPAIDVDALSKRYGRVWALRDVTLDVGRGERVFVVGDNGSGKSTLLRLLAATTRPTRGGVRIAGQSTSRDPDFVRRHVTFLSDRPAMYGELTALENLRFTGVMHGISSGSTELRTILDAVGLAQSADVPVRGFSRGMAQRLALAGAVLRPAELVVLDEPYTALDADGISWVDDWLDELRARGATVVVASHQITPRGGAAARVLTLRAGRVISDRGPRPTPSPCRQAASAHPDHDWRRAWAVAVKDIRTERRAPAALGAIACFSALVLLMFGFALGPDARQAAPGLGWVAVLLASVLALDRASQIEIERGGWDGLRLAPGARWPIYAGKVMATTALLVVVELVLLPCAVMLYDLPVPPWSALAWLGAAAILSTLGIAAAGTLYAALTANIRARQALLPLLLFPIMVPVVLAAVKVTTLLLRGDPLGELAGWMKLLVAADLVYLATGVIGFGVALDD